MRERIYALRQAGIRAAAKESGLRFEMRRNFIFVGHKRSFGLRFDSDGLCGGVPRRAIEAQRDAGSCAELSREGPSDKTTARCPPHFQFAARSGQLLLFKGAA